MRAFLKAWFGLCSTLTMTLICSHGVGGELLKAGPMLGHASHEHATVWFQTASESEFRVSAKPRNGQVPPPVRVEDLGRGCRLAHISGLTPDSEVEVEIKVGFAATSEVGTLRVRTFPEPAETGSVRLAFGSCAKITQYQNAPIYLAMANERPDLALFVGDNSYFIVNDGSDKSFSTSGPVGDWTSADLMFARHMENRTTADLQKLIRTTPCYAVWDDHDYGPNNADRDFALKNEALDVFKTVWANPAYGRDAIAGIFSSFRAGPVEVFLMDDRFHKYVKTEEHPDVPDTEASIWGAGQLQWLMDSLKASTAPVKLIANGTQVISETAKGEGHFQEALAERDRLFAFLREHRIGGVVFLSGDRHYSESMRLEQEGGPWILEFTSSPMQQGKPIAPLDRVRHRTQLWGLDGNSYGLVTVEIPEPGKGTIRFEARDEKNQVPIIRAQRTVTTTDLRKLYY